MADTRKDKRAPVSLKVRFKSATVDQFIEQYSIDISRGGLFIKSKSPMPVGTLLKFEFQLKDESRLIQGVGRVVWMRMVAQSSDPDRPPGMGVKFIKMDPQSRAIVERIVAPRGERPAAYESGTAEAAPPPPQPRQGGFAYADVRAQSEQPFFPSTTPESELPPLEDRTQVRHASQFLASAVVQAGVDPDIAQQAQEEAWRARRRTEELERQRAVAASLNSEVRGDSIRPTNRPPERTSRPAASHTVSYGDYGGLFGSGPHVSPVTPGELTTANANEKDDGAADSSLPPSTRYKSIPVAMSGATAHVAAGREDRRSSAGKFVWIVLLGAAALALLGMWGWHDGWFDSVLGRAISAPSPEASAITQRASQVNAPKPTLPSPPPSAATAPTSPATFKVEVRSDPSGAMVMQDGIEKGKTPTDLEFLANTQATITLKHPGFAAVAKQIGPAKPQTPLHVKLPPLAYVLEIVTNPPGADVTALGQSKHAPGVFTLGVVKNNFVVRAHKPGFVPQERVVMVDDFQERTGQMRHRLVLDLKAKAPGVSPEPVLPPPVESPVPSPPSSDAPTAPSPKTPAPVPPKPEPPQPEPPKQEAPIAPPSTKPAPVPAPPAPEQNPELPTNPF
ncbi:MAG: TIGR02266 family protein [Myxococcales bacterium]|nr:TIGR02266 family protein [Myxococcales bacterium]MCB9707504.1 TIGR02266 family protein [Myxococcales bacterium]